MSNHPLAEDYLRWLAPQIREEDDGLSNPSREFWGLLQIMFEKEFVWVQPIVTDNNRIDDGRDLRTRFCYEHRMRPNALKNLGPVSFLEVLIGISRRLEFIAGGSAPGWAWLLLSNLGLHHSSDPLSRKRVREIDDILECCIWRLYQPNGRGGFFPLRNPAEDQRQVEIWYQMAAYIDDVSTRRR